MGGLLLVVALLAPTLAAAQTASPHRAGVVVVHGDGRVVTRCVSFDEEAISGADLLRRSGLPVTLSAYGGLGYGVCAIDGEGCWDAQDCFCHCQGESCAYWTYSHRQADGSWAISGLGASAWMVGDGDVEGWVWGDGTTAPPLFSFGEICSSNPAVLPTAVPTRSPSPTPTSQPTVVPTRSPSPAPTSQPTAVPTRSPSPAPTSMPTAAPTDQPALQPAAPPSALPAAGPADYAVYGLLVLFLLLGLVWGLSQRR